jgi:C-terminal processing protease CtpA/Prc
MSAIRAVAAEPGWFGVTYTVHADGFLNPTIESVSVASVRADSPAGRGQVGVGDEVVAVDDHVVAGSKARELQALMTKVVGEAVHLRLKRANGEVYTVTLIAALSRKD